MSEICERESSSKPSRRVTHYSTSVNDDEMEFIRAIEDYKATHRQPFLSWSEVLGVLKRLGYAKTTR